MLKGIIFDMDGVLVNSEPMHYKACCMVLEEYGIIYPYEKYKKFIGSTDKKIIEDIRSFHPFPCSDEDYISKLKEKKDTLITCDGFEGIAGTPELIKALHAAGFLLAVASSSPYEYIIRVTKALGIYHYFHQIVSGVNVPHPKPAPDVFFKTAKELRLAPSECLVIEDSKNGVKAANAAGMPCIGYYNPDSGDQDLSDAVLIIDSFESLAPSFIKKVYDSAK